MIYIFRTISAAISIYSLLCVVRIILTWIPGMAYSSFGRFLSAICDPFLNVFSGIRWLHFGVVDFSPILAFAVLTMISYLFNNLASGIRITFGGILAMLVQMAWSIAASLIFFLIIVVTIRLIVFLMGSDRSMLWQQIDSSINPLIYSIAKFFSGGRPLPYKSALVIAIVVLAILRFGGAIVISGLAKMCLLIPF